MREFVAEWAAPQHTLPDKLALLMLARNGIAASGTYMQMRRKRIGRDTRAWPRLLWGSHEFNEIARGAENRMTNAVNVPDSAIRMHNAIIYFFV
jgi:hypothetical protein